MLSLHCVHRGYVDNAMQLLRVPEAAARCILQFTCKTHRLNRKPAHAHLIAVVQRKGDINMRARCSFEDDVKSGVEKTLVLRCGGYCIRLLHTYIQYGVHRLYTIEWTPATRMPALWRHENHQPQRRRVACNVMPCDMHQCTSMLLPMLHICYVCI